MNRGDKHKTKAKAKEKEDDLWANKQSKTRATRDEALKQVPLLSSQSE